MSKRQRKVGSIIRYLKAMARERERAQSFMRANPQYIKPGIYRIRRMGMAVVCQDSATYGLIPEQALGTRTLLHQLKQHTKQFLSSLFRIRITEKLFPEHTNTFTIDATQNYDAEVRQIKHIIWKQLQGGN